MSEAIEARVLPLEGVHNFRDYGGYPARGGRLRSRWLWRSGQHRDATAEDLAAIHALDLAAVIDLRGDGERAAFPCARHPEFAAEVVFAPGEQTEDGSGKAVHEEWADRCRTADQALAVMTDLYALLPYRPALVATLRLYLRRLAGGEGASLVHCFAGKDRTGLAVALVQRLLGVHPDDVMADYLLTNIAGNQQRRIAALQQMGTALDPGAARVLMGVDARFLDASFAAIAARHGTVEAYAGDVLGLDATGVEAMAERLIV